MGRGVCPGVCLMSLCIHGLDEATCATCLLPRKKQAPKKVTEIPYVPPVGQRKDWYHNVYMRSEHWKKLKAKALKDKPNVCFGCGTAGTKTRLEMHHLGYTHLYQERGSDLRLLCRSCHEGVHSLAQEEKCSLRAATKKWRLIKQGPGNYDPKLVRAEREKRGKHYKKYAGPREYRRSIQRLRKKGIVGSDEIVKRSPRSA